MYLTDKKFITPEMKMSELILENPSLLLIMERFGLSFMVRDKSVAQICKENKTSTNVFVLFANLYNGFHLSGDESFSNSEISDIILYLRNSHNYYEEEKYPEIINYIKELHQKNNSPEIKLIDKFFIEYFEEVKEHLSYENMTVFPYFHELLQCRKQEDHRCCGHNFSVEEYREHHTDIESKLNDLKNLLLKHVPVQQDAMIRRKIIMRLFELEYDLKIHSIIEETVLIPLIYELEKNV